MRLSQLQPNNGQIDGVPSNPRYITEEEFKELKRSIKDFTKMMSLRPIVVDEGMNILGGNMRYQALCRLAQEGATTEVLDKDGAIAGYFKFEDEIPDEWVKVASNLTIDEKIEFVYKDNDEKGKWDYEALDKGWNTEQAKWDVPKDNRWKPENREDAEHYVDDTSNDGEPNTHTHNTQSNDDEDFNLPPELDGVDIEPDALPTIEGEDDRENEYLIITYLPEQKAELEAMLGKPIEKIVHNISELL